MKCNQGDLARIVFSIRPENIGRIVKVREYIGKFNQGKTFEFRTLTCMCAVTDHYWWIEADDLSIGLGVSPQAYIPDSWLEPIRPEGQEQTQKQDIKIAA
jgi:hypothetical protein